jgi:hypothetical protein
LLLHSQFKKLKLVYATTSLENGNCGMARNLPDRYLCILAFVALCKRFCFTVKNVVPYARHCACDGVRDAAFLDKNVTHLAAQRPSLNL